MKLVITGSAGNIGRRLMPAFPGSIGIDRAHGTNIVAELMTLDYDRPDVRAALRSADGLVHLATSADPEAPDAVHFGAVTATARLVAACAAAKVPRLVLASSDWAEPKTKMADTNTYGHSKRVFEAMAAMYAHATGGYAVGLRIGWVPHDPEALRTAPEWLQKNYWDDARLIGEVRGALGLYV